MISRFELIVAIVKSEKDFIINNGHARPGNNGPYGDDDTPCRNTAHFLVTTSFLYKKTADDQYKKLAVACYNYLKGEKARPMSSIFWCRKNEEKDFANGLMGQAWAVEALLYYYDVFKESEVLEIAVSNLVSHDFNTNYGLWYIHNVDGSRHGIDWTFNHQLWFASVVGETLTRTSNVDLEERLKCFILNLNKNFRVNYLGRIKHIVGRRLSLDSIYPKLKAAVRTLKNLILLKSDKQKENGYQLFNLYAFAMLHNSGFVVGVEIEKKIQQAVNYIVRRRFIDSLEVYDKSRDTTVLNKRKDNDASFNPYSYSYNAPGFAIDFILVSLSRFFTDSTVRQRLYTEQIKSTFDADDSSFRLNTDDPFTLAARCYEMVRYLDKDQSSE